MDKNLLNYTIRLGDNCLVLGQRMSMWCSNGPTLEEDIALTNISLDLFGRNCFLLFAEEIDNKNTAEISLLKEMRISFQTILLLNLITQTLALQLSETFSLIVINFYFMKD